MGQWQGIATAPKDGVRILLFCARVMGSIRSGYWFRYEHQTEGATSFRYDGWWLDGFNHPFNQPPFEPTHWQPLPDPPEPPGTRLPVPENDDMSLQSEAPRECWAHCETCGLDYRLGVSVPCPLSVYVAALTAAKCPQCRSRKHQRVYEPGRTGLPVTPP